MKLCIWALTVSLFHLVLRFQRTLYEIKVIAQMFVTWKQLVLNLQNYSSQYKPHNYPTKLNSLAFDLHCDLLSKSHVLVHVLVQVRVHKKASFICKLFNLELISNIRYVAQMSFFWIGLILTFSKDRIGNPYPMGKIGSKFEKKKKSETDLSCGNFFRVPLYLFHRCIFHFVTVCMTNVY